MSPDQFKTLCCGRVAEDKGTEEQKGQNNYQRRALGNDRFRRPWLWHGFSPKKGRGRLGHVVTWRDGLL